MQEREGRRSQLKVQADVKEECLARAKRINGLTSIEWLLRSTCHIDISRLLCFLVVLKLFFTASH